MKISFFGNDRQYSALAPIWKERVEQVWRSGQYFNSPIVNDFEQRLAARCHRKHAVALASCSDALYIAALFFSKKQWAVTNYSFISSASSALRANSSISLCDICHATFNPSVTEYKKAISSKPGSTGVIHVELFGNLTHVEEVEQYCLDNDVPLIEDAAQSFGAARKGRPAGNFGDVSCLSFDPTKTLSATSAAGALLTDNEEIFEFAKKMRLHGRNQQHSFDIVGLKSQMASSEAAILNLKLDYLDGWIERRNDIAYRYNSSFSELSLVKCPQANNETMQAFHKYVVRVPEYLRSKLRNHLGLQGIETRIHYPNPLNQEPALSSFALENLPESLLASQEVLSLPIYPELLDDEVNYITQQVHSFFQNEN